MAAAAIVALVAAPLQAGAQPLKNPTAKHTLQARKVGTYGEVLTDSAGDSLYLLSTESKGVLHCTSGYCLSAWPPLLVARNAKVTVGPGVKGKVSHVTRGSKWQVTYNGWPVYTYEGDSAAGQANGENVSSFGGTWYLLHAGARTNSATPVKP